FRGKLGPQRQIHRGAGRNVRNGRRPGLDEKLCRLVHEPELDLGALEDSVPVVLHLHLAQGVFPVRKKKASVNVLEMEREIHGSGNARKLEIKGGYKEKTEKAGGGRKSGEKNAAPSFFPGRCTLFSGTVARESRLRALEDRVFARFSRNELDLGPLAA